MRPDSREGFCAEEFESWLDSTNQGWEDDYDNDVEDDGQSDDYEDDGQPSEYEEWQDYMDGDDWDQGQYDTDY